MTLTTRAVVTLTPGLASADIDGEIVCMDVARGQYVSIGGPGPVLMSVLEQGPATVGDLCRAAREEFEIDDEHCLREISDFVRRLRDEGLASIQDVP